MTLVPVATRTRLAIAQLTLVDDLRVREIIDPWTCKAYAELMREGAAFPPLGVVQTDDGTYLLYDGWHRREALIMNGQTTAECAIVLATKDVAQFLACTANARHALPMNQADKRRVVQLLLSNPAYSDPAVWSDRRIASELGVSHVFVGGIREAMDPEIAAARYKRRADRAAEVPMEPVYDSMLDHEVAPSHLPPFVPVARPDWRRLGRGASVPGTRRAGRATRDSTGQITISAPRRETRAARDEDRASRPSALTPFTSSLPVDAAVEARIKAREIKISWREQGQIKTASLDDLSEVPDDVLATLYQALTEELARRTRQASE